MKKILAFLVMALLAMPLAASAWTPDGDVTVIVAYKAGSGTDTGARLLASQAEKYVGKTLIINNLPGGDGKIGWTELVNSKPDGRTIGFINLPTFTTLAVQPGSTFAVSDVVPVCNQLSETGVVVVRANSPWKSLKELVDACKAKGKLRCSTNGGSFQPYRRPAAGHFRRLQLQGHPLRRYRRPAAGPAPGRSALLLRQGGRRGRPVQR